MYTQDQIELAPDVPADLIVGEVDIIAAACHQQNRMYCQMTGDDSQPLWLDAPEWQTSSAIEGVRKALLNPNPAASHESWLAHKAADGWVYGKEKDPVAKTHHCMVPYSDLPEAQKKKDHFFVEMVQQLGLVGQLIVLK